MVPPCFCDTIITPKPDQVTTRSVTSAFFIDHKLGVCTVLFVGADEDQIRVCGNAEASVTGFGFQLISQISGAIVQEFHGASIGCAALQATRCCYQRGILDFTYRLSISFCLLSAPIISLILGSPLIMQRMPSQFVVFIKFWNASFILLIT